MTRSKEIETAAFNYVKSDAVPAENMRLSFGDFINGAKWADEHPQFDKETFIEKACWWLRETAHFYVSDFTGELDDNGLLEGFKKAMEE